jgi:transposase
MLDKRGNSNSKERIDLINRFIGLFGKQVIQSVAADREFVGKNRLAFLNRNEIRYYIRIRNNFKVFLPQKNKEIKASHLFNCFKTNQFVYYNKIVRINEQLCYLSGCKGNSKNIKQYFLIIVSFNKPENAQEEYQKRWQIEMYFKAMKSSVFDIEKTYLQDIQRIEKLILLVMIAFILCYKIGIYLHQITPITIKKHGRKAKSIFKYGLTFLANILLNSENQKNIDILHFL